MTLGDASIRPRLRAGGTLLTVVSAGIVSLMALGGCEESRAPAKTPTTSGASAKETLATSETNGKTSTAGPSDASPATTDANASTSESKTEPTTAAPAAAPSASPAVEDSATRNITFDRIKFDLKSNADYKPEMLTPEIKALDGKNVRIRGFMFPSFKPTGLTEWVLVRDNMQCCFGGNAILYDCIIVDMKPGKSTDYTTRIVNVEGTFTIRDWFDLDGVRRAIYHLDGEAVRF